MTQSGDDPTVSDAAEAGPGEAGSAQADPAQPGSAQPGSAQSGPTQPGADSASSVGAESGSPVESPEATAEEQLAERTLDLQRLQAEYQNYRKRVERDRALARAQGSSAVLKSLLTVLDDIGRAEEHGELTGGFKAVADQLRQVAAAQGLEPFGSEGDEFDPRLHEALFQVAESDAVDAATIGKVVRTGYRVGDDVLRDAQVGVISPVSRTDGAPETAQSSGGQTGDAQAVDPQPSGDSESGVDDE